MTTPNQALILIVEDYTDAREIYRDYLTFKGYRVIVADNGQEGVTVARAQRPALILMDIRMPEMTGTQAMRLLRSDATFSDVPIVALTAHALADESAAQLAAGFDEVITKPCDLDDLVVAIERLLSGAREVH